MKKVSVLVILWFHAALLVLSSQSVLTEQNGHYQEDTAMEMVNSRTGVIDTIYRWTNNIVPYQFMNLDSDQAAYVRETLDKMEAVLCLTFVPRTNETNYVQVKYIDSTCISHVGMIGLSQQTLGFRAMHRAVERDNYVKINWENIVHGKEDQFQIVDPDRNSLFGVPYDYGSVTHYSATAYSVNGEPTIVPLDPKAVIGQRDGMSDYDIQRIRNMYCP